MRQLAGSLLVVLSVICGSAAAVVVANSTDVGATTTSMWAEGIDGQFTYTGASTNVQVTGSSVELRFYSNDYFWALNVHAPDGETLHTGTYEGAKLYTFGSSSGSNPGIAETDGTTGHIGCGLPGGAPIAATGRFIIDELTFDANGVPATAAVRYEYRCEPYTRIIFGAVAVATTTVYPTHIFSPTVANLGPHHLGTSTHAPVQLTNSGSASLHIDSVAISGPANDFAVSGCTGADLAPTQSCSLDVVFTPTGAVGARTATIRIFDTISPTGGSGRPFLLTGSATGSDGEYHAVSPTRIVDTRLGQGTQCPDCIPRATAVGPQEVLDVPIAGAAGGLVPSSGVSAVVVQVAAVSPTSAGWFTLFPNNGDPPPTAANLNFAAGQTTANLVTVKLSASGHVGLANTYGAASAGYTHAVFDVVGYYNDPSGADGSRFHGQDPIRILDTRIGNGSGCPTCLPITGPRAPNSTTTLDVTTPDSGIPDNATAVALNVVAVGPQTTGWLTLWPTGQPPTAANVNFAGGQTVANLVIVKVSNGTVQLGNTNGSPSAGYVNVVADAVGWYDDDRSTEAGRFVPLAPYRNLDTRFDDQPLGPGEAFDIGFAGQGGMPTEQQGHMDTVLVNVTATGPTDAGWLTLFPADDADVPLAASVNFGPGATVPNLVMVAVSSYSPGPGGDVGVYNGPGYTDVILDSGGYFTGD